MLYRIDFEIGIYPNRIQVCDRRSGRFVDLTPDSAFSSPDRLVSNKVYFENTLAKAIRKALNGGFILLDAQALVTSGGDMLLPDERPTIRRALSDIGFKEVRFENEIGDVAPTPPIPAMLAGLF